MLKQVTRARIGGADPGELIVTTGSQQGFELLLRILLEPGDGVVIERPCYPAAIQALRSMARDRARRTRMSLNGGWSVRR